MRLIAPEPPSFDPLAWREQPFAQRARAVCSDWVDQGYGAPLAIYVVYLLKIAGFIAAWVAFCSRSPTLGSWGDIGRWWLDPLAFQKALLWAAVFEILGLGCGSGPLTGRYLPPVGGFLYFARPGTLKLPLAKGWPLIGGRRRNVVDVLLYLGVVGFGLALLWGPTLDRREIAIWLGLLALASLGDRILFLAARGEHYAVTLAVFAYAGPTDRAIAAAMAVQGALWFFAGVSKLNHHFPNVVSVMVSNSPWPIPRFLRRAMVKAYPTDLRPSRLATWLAHGGTVLELAVPAVLLTQQGPRHLLVGMVLMIALHSYITSNIPMGVPLEWNVVVVYGAFALFWAHPNLHVTAMDLPLAAWVIGWSVVLPIIGNVWPARVPFLLAMRYYAGNWAMGVWLFRGDAHKKLHENLVCTSPWVEDQLAKLYDEPTRTALLSKVMAFRLMHLHGRALPDLLPRAFPEDDTGTTFDGIQWVDGEIVAGLVLGWNFGDGHLHHEALLEAVREECGFEPGELRCIFVEAQPLGGDSHHFRIHDAATGLIEEGQMPIATMRERQPWGDDPSVTG